MLLEKKKKKVVEFCMHIWEGEQSAEQSFHNIMQPYLATTHTLQKLKTKVYLHELSLNSNKFNMSRKEYGFQERKLHLQIFHKFETFYN